MRPRASWLLILAPIFSNNFTVSSWRPEMACIKGVEPWKEKKWHKHETFSQYKKYCAVTLSNVYIWGSVSTCVCWDLASEVISIPLYIWTISQLQCNHSCAHINAKEAKIREGLRIQCLLTFISIDITSTSFFKED